MPRRRRPLGDDGRSAAGLPARDEVATSNVAIAIGADGRVTACALVVARARYRPARDATGAAVPGVDRCTFRWPRPVD